MRLPSIILSIILGGAACANPAPAPIVPVPMEGSGVVVRPAGGPVATRPAAGSSDAEALAARELAIPVAGTAQGRITDSFDAPRDGGARRHGAIDILAPRGTPILSADAGRVLRMSTSTLGGITLYATDPEDRFVYYYAHMERYHRSMAPGRVLARGDTIGFVGTTGNAPANTPHLHFQIMRMPADGKYWSGEPINPYPVLRGSAGAGRRLD